MEFVSVKGKVYDERTVLPVVMSLLARQMRFARDGRWREAVRQKMRDVEWLKFRAGMCPAGLAGGAVQHRDRRVT